MRLVLLMLAAVVGLQAQDFIVTYQSTSATSEVITVQRPASGQQMVRFIGFSVECNVACLVTLERNGTAATSTTLTIAKVNPSSTQAVSSTAWRSSNVGVGTVLGKYGASMPSTGGTVSVDLSKCFMSGTGTGKNLTIRISSSSAGTYNTAIQMTESTL